MSPARREADFHLSWRVEIKSIIQDSIAEDRSSTGWFRSVLSGARGIELGLGLAGEVEPFNFPWDSDYLYYTVREPWPSTSSSAKLVFGRIEAGETLNVTSQMGSGGTIFSDGILDDALDFNTPTQVKIGLSPRRAHLVLPR